MKKQKILKKTLIVVLVFVLILFTNKYILAADSTETIKEIEYSEEFLEWLELDDEEKENSVMPRMYDISSYRLVYSNPIQYLNLLQASVDSSSTSTFTLKDIIAANMEIKNQGNLGACWAFASLGALETNLALQDYYNDAEETVYDYSEMHLEYATASTVSDGTVNENGFSRSVGDGGNYLISSAYLTNGTGAIDETELEYNDDTSNANITLDDIQNVTVTSQIYDTIEFPSASPTDEDIDDVIALMKNHIKNYSGIYSSIHEPEDGDETCLNTETGALYCSSSSDTANHAILIVGWDDDYSASNFTEGSQPSSDGAWIVRDSHGDEDDWVYTYTLEELLESFESWFTTQGVSSTEEITDEVIEALVEALNEAYPTYRIY